MSSITDRDLAISFLNSSLQFNDGMGGYIIMPSELVAIQAYCSSRPEMADIESNCDSNKELMDNVVNPMINELILRFDVLIVEENSRVIRYE